MPGNLALVRSSHSQTRLIDSCHTRGDHKGMPAMSRATHEDTRSALDIVPNHWLSVVRVIDHAYIDKAFFAILQ